MKRSTLWLIIGGVVLLTATIGYRLGESGKDSSATRTSMAAGGAFPGLVLIDTHGKTQHLDQWRGKVLVLNYWATWCFPCREEMPGFSRLQDKFQDKGVQFVGISTDDAAKIIEFQKEASIGYPLLIGDMGTMTKSAEFGNSRQALPFTAVFDRRGNLAMSKLGRWNEADLEPRLVELIAR